MNNTLVLSLAMSCALLSSHAHANVFYGEGYSLTINSSAYDYSFQDNKLTVEVNDQFHSSVGLGTIEKNLYQATITIEDGYVLDFVSVALGGEYVKTTSPGGVQGAAHLSARLESNLRWSFIWQYPDGPSFLETINNLMNYGISESNQEPNYSSAFEITGRYDTSPAMIAYNGIYTLSPLLTLHAFHAGWPRDHSTWISGSLSYGVWEIGVVRAVPEPSGYALLGLGLGIIGFAARKKINKGSA